MSKKVGNGSNTFYCFMFVLPYQQLNLVAIQFAMFQKWKHSAYAVIFRKKNSPPSALKARSSECKESKLRSVIAIWILQLDFVCGRAALYLSHVWCFHVSAWFWGINTDTLNLMTHDADVTVGISAGGGPWFTKINSMLQFCVFPTGDIWPFTLTAFSRPAS